MFLKHADYYLSYLLIVFLQFSEKITNFSILGLTMDFTLLHLILKGNIL